MGNSTRAVDYGMQSKSFSVYFSGFLLCIILTLIPFYAVMHKVTSKPYLWVILFVTAFIQFLVQVVCFLRLKSSTNQGMINILSFLFTGIVTFIVVGGSIWIMANLNYFMAH